MPSCMLNACLLLRHLNCKDIWNLRSSEIVPVILGDNTAHTWGSLPKGTKGGWHIIKKPNLPIKYQTGEQFAVCNKLHLWKIEFLGPATVSMREAWAKGFLNTDVCQTDGCNNLFSVGFNYHILLLLLKMSCRGFQHTTLNFQQF